MKHKAVFSLLFVIGLIASAIGWGMHRNSRLERMFKSVHAGASEKQVLQLLGKPSRVEPCGKSFGPSLANCIEYIYRDSFAPMIPQYWSVSFDTSGPVQKTFIYQSP